jgi:hypothetical protein
VKKSLLLVAVGLCVATMLTVLPGSAEEKGDTRVPYAKDGENTKPTRWKDLRGARYMEFFLIGGEPVDGEFKGTCYNTTGLNLAEGSRDSCPQAQVDKLDAAKLAKEFGVAKVYVNPPRQWMLDWLDIALGAEREFGGLKATWCAVLNVPKGVEKGKGPEPYKAATIARKSKFGFNKGSKVHLLDDPEGNTWIQKSLTQAVNRENTLEDFDKIGSRLKLPEGWKSRMKVLDEDLILVPESGVARIVSDDLDDVYDLTGKGYSNYKP